MLANKAPGFIAFFIPGGVRIWGLGESVVRTRAALRLRGCLWASKGGDSKSSAMLGSHCRIFQERLTLLRRGLSDGWKVVTSGMRSGVGVML